jgi:hypothetical protein
METVKFPGYKYEKGISTYMGEEVGEGGYVYAEPGVHTNVALLDVASMHPTSIVAMNLFGPYTKRFSDLMQARLALKHGEFDKLETLLDGALLPFVGEDSELSMDDLTQALKLVINSVYGYTKASFKNPFLDPRNVDNIVAKRGALFMIDLKHFVQERGFNVAHIKTDSIKIPDADEHIIRDVMEFGSEYGYTFEHEATYKVMALVNRAVYIAETTNPKSGESYWTATGKMFQQPYVFETMFGTENTISYKDLGEARSVKQGSIYIEPEEQASRYSEANDSEEDNAERISKMHFVGRTGVFYPVKPGHGGGLLWRVMDGCLYSVSNTKGYLWKEAYITNSEDVDYTYYDDTVRKAMEAIVSVGSYRELIESSTLPRPRQYDKMLALESEVESINVDDIE